VGDILHWNPLSNLFLKHCPYTVEKIKKWLVAKIFQRKCLYCLFYTYSSIDKITLTNNPWFAARYTCKDKKKKKKRCHKVWFQIGKDVKLDYDPCAVQYYNEGKYLIIGGSNGRANMYSREGAFLGVVTNSKGGWVWCIGCRPNSNMVVSLDKTWQR